VGATGIEEDIIFNENPPVGFRAVTDRQTRETDLAKLTEAFLPFPLRQSQTRVDPMGFRHKLVSLLFQCIPKSGYRKHFQFLREMVELYYTR
jgi:hypothetical protein